MPNGRVEAIFIAPAAGAPMQQVREVMAIAGRGLEGDRYAAVQGSYSKGELGRRQVTLINGIFFPGTDFDYAQSRRNIVTLGVELMWLIVREFWVGAALFRGKKYCEPCPRPSKLSGKSGSFETAFHDKGGLVAEILEGGLICEGDELIPPPKGY